MSGLVLASRSLTRARMLADAGVAFEVRAANIDEAALKADALAAGCDPWEIAQHLAAAKAQAVLGVAGELVIGADQTLDLDGRLFDKPATRVIAREQLQAFRGRLHRLHSAVAVARDGALVWAAVESVTLHVRPFSDAFLDRYLDTEGDAVLSCVGAYRLEGLGVQLFERVEGDYFTVLGLPLLPLLAFLRAQGLLAR